jgi:hypothetical protein
VEDSQVVFGSSDLDFNSVKATLIDFHDLLMEGNANEERPQADTGGIS